MKKLLATGFFAMLIFLSCTHSASLPEQLKTNFSEHVKKIDSALALDSFRVMRIDTLVEKIGRIIDDSIYKRELYRVQLQLANAIKRQRKDSIAIYQDEVNYMLPQIDSVTNSISKGDTTKKFGVLAVCLYQLRKNNTSAKGFAFYFLNTKMSIMNADMIDSTIYSTYRKLK
jgi:hypothetical protein